METGGLIPRRFCGFDGSLAIFPEKLMIAIYYCVLLSVKGGICLLNKKKRRRAVEALPALIWVGVILFQMLVLAKLKVQETGWDRGPAASLAQEVWQPLP